MDATPSVRLPAGRCRDCAAPAPAAQDRRAQFRWGRRTYVMGIVNVTPDSFCGDGLLAGSPTSSRRRGPGPRMVADGADILDVGGESSRPGHADMDSGRGNGRVLPVIGEIRAVLPNVPMSIDTVRRRSGRAGARRRRGHGQRCLGRGPVGRDGAAGGGTESTVRRDAQPERPRYHNVLAEVMPISGAPSTGPCPWLRVGIADRRSRHRLRQDRRTEPRVAARPRPLQRWAPDPAGNEPQVDDRQHAGPAGRQRLEGTLATTALGVGAGVDIVRVHDVRANVRGRG